jgi:lysozyme
MNPLPDPALPWPILLDGVYLLADRECLRLSAYRCQAGKPTIGWGETDGVRMGDTCTKEQADRWLCDDLVDRTKAVLALCTVTPSQHELAAMVVFAYNVGVEGLARSSVLRCHNDGDHLAASRAFALWNKYHDPITGQLQVSNGLTITRAKEAALYLTLDEQNTEPPPQAVQSESNIVTDSPIMKGGAVTVAAGTVTAAVSAADELSNLGGALSKLHGFSDQLAQWTGLSGGIWFGIIVVVAGVFVIRYRWEQRKQGWA